MKTVVRTVRPILSDTEYAAIIALEQNKEFDVFKELLVRRAADTAVLSTDFVGEECHWMQGRSKELRDLVYLIETARESFEAIRRNNKGELK